VSHNKHLIERLFFSYKAFFLIEPMLILHSWGQLT
jgi:hypothetical protein